MGAFLSCLRPFDGDEDQINERSALLSNQQIDETNIEQRNRELDEMVNQLSEDLIDVQTFSNPVEQEQYLISKTSRAKLNQAVELPRPLNLLISNDKKQKLRKCMDQLEKVVDESNEIVDVGPLILEFN